MVAAVGILLFLSVFAFSLQPTTTPSGPPPLPSGSAYPVNVTFIQLVSPRDVCDLNFASEPGFTGVSDAASGETWHITGPPGGCTMSGLQSETAGFQVLTLSLPTTIPAGQSASISVSFDMTELGGPYTGVLSIEVT